MKRFLFTLIACASMQATTIDLAVNPGVYGGAVPNGNTMTFTTGSLSVTLSAFSNFNNGATFTQGSVQQFGDSIGVGACNTAEDQLFQCNQDDWQVSSFTDNSPFFNGVPNGTYRDFVLMTFNQLVTVQDVIRLQSSTFGYDSDFQWWYTTNLVTQANFTGLGQFTSGGSHNGPFLDYIGFGPYPTANGTINTPVLRSLLIAPGQSSTDGGDRFKLYALNAQAAVPEPGSMALLGSGLLGLGALARKRRK